MCHHTNGLNSGAPRFPESDQVWFKLSESMSKLTEMSVK